MELRGGEILLRRWRMDDAPTVAQACRDPEIPRWIPFVPSPYTGEDARAYVRGCVDAPEGRQPFAITAAEDGREGVLRSHLLQRDGRRRDSVMSSLLPGEVR